MEYGMNQGLVCPFGPKPCQDVAMVSPNPLECLRTLKTHKNHQNLRISNPSSLIPPLALCGLIGLLALRLAPPAQFTLVVPALYCKAAVSGQP